MPTDFRKPGCDCHGCTAYAEHEDPNEFRGWHIITLTHHPQGGERADCRCGWRVAASVVGNLIRIHRENVGYLS